MHYNPTHAGKAQDQETQAARPANSDGRVQEAHRRNRTGSKKRGRGQEAQAEAQANQEAVAAPSPRYLAFCLPQGPLDEAAGIRKYRKGGLFSDNLRLVERYIEDVEHIGLRFADAPSGDHYIFFQALPVRAVGAELDGRRFSAESDRCNVNARGQERAVLVHIVESMQDPKQIYSVISRVWLQTPDKCFTGASQNSYLSLRTGMVEHFSRLTDRERNVFEVDVWIVPQSDSAREMIERGTEIMDSVSHDRDNVARNNGGAVSDFEDFMQSIRLCLFDDRVAVELVGFPNPRFKLADVLVGPM